MARAAVVAVVDGRVALIRRQPPGQEPYCVFPGGKVEPGETPEQAAVREAHEELGIHVRLGRLWALEDYNGDPRRYYWATPVGGTFGTGGGAEMRSPAGSTRGTYTPVRVPLAALADYRTYPLRLARLLAAGERLSDPLVFVDDED